MTRVPRKSIVRSLAIRGMAVVIPVVLALIGCGALNPAFVTQLGGGAAASLTTVDNATGHIVVAFSNNATLDERLLNYLESQADNIPGFAEAAAGILKPAVRFRVQVTYSDLSQRTFEFAEGSPVLGPAGFEEVVANNFVFPCEVVAVELDATRPVEVYVPVELAEYEQLETVLPSGAVSITYEVDQRIPPHWETLEVDDVDEQGFVILPQRNFAPGDVPADISPSCGVVAPFILNGTMSVPFLVGVDEAPSYDQDDASAVAGIGGRFSLRTDLR